MPFVGIQRRPVKISGPLTNAIELLEHTYEIGGAGVQVVVNGWDSDFARKVRERREKLDYISKDRSSCPTSQEDLPAFEQTVVNAKEAESYDTCTVTSTGRRYEENHTAAEVEDFKKKAVQQI